jgi:hypothetical protein
MFRIEQGIINEKLKPFVMTGRGLICGVMRMDRSSAFQCTLKREHKGMHVAAGVDGYIHRIFDANGFVVVADLWDDASDPFGLDDAGRW